MTMPERNIELLQQTMQHILDHPEQHDQTIWMNECRTVACFAGWTCLLSGQVSSYWVFIPNRAIDLLGLTEDEANILFSERNTIPQLQLMVKDLVNGDELNIERYLAE